ncbi:D-alanyl-D-alanine carboxypeptidase family protein [Actinomadura kijaniata]|uniref:D-alanyl-D-alanine carboxypeptidase family protein n=1 Tax=Actinomadura kijaniata TaxID=46161 RepID=UPI003F1C2C24
MRSSARCAVAVALAAPVVAVPVATAHAEPAVSAKAGPSGVHAKSALLLDVGARKVRWSRSAHTKRRIGSITKVMTAYVVIKSGNLDRKITVQRKHIDYLRGNGAGGSSAGLVVGDRLTVRQLLRALMLPSGCDAAYVLADAYGPGWKGFVAKMNKTARGLKMTNTKYANFDGIDWKGATMYSTAYDQTRLAAAAMKLKEFRSVVGTRSYRVPPTSTTHIYNWTNTNALLGKYKGMTGVKTGFTNLAGASFMFGAKRGGRELVGIVLNSGSGSYKSRRFTDASKILNWGFGVRSADLPVMSRSLDDGRFD